MFPAQQDLHNHTSTMNQYGNASYQFMNSDLFPFTTTPLTELSSGMRSPVMQHYSSSSDLFEQRLSNREDELNTGMSSKKYLSKAERRAEHNAIERARRENLNTKFQSLAQLLPNLINYRRPSKSQIVEKTLEWIKKSISRDERQRYQILQLQLENKRLMVQCMSQEQHQQPYRLQQQQEKFPIIRPGISNKNNNMSIGPTTMINNTSPTPNVYSADSINTNNWSIHPHLLNPNHRMSTYPSAKKLSKQDYSSRSDNDSVIEDDINYQRSPCTFMKNLPPQKQYNDQRQQFIVPELYSAGLNTLNNWNQQEYSSHTMNGKDIDPGISGRSMQC